VGLLLSAATLSACATVGPNFKSPAAPASAGYAMAGDPTPKAAALAPETRDAGPWWRALGSPSLDEVMTQALADNQTAAEALATLDTARAQARAVRGDLAPQVTGSASAEETRINITAFGLTFPGISNPTVSLLSVGAAVNYDLDLFGGGRRRVETARAEVEAAGRRADAAYLTLTGNVALEAVRIAGLRAQIDALKAITEDDRRNIEFVRRAETIGGEARSATPGGVAQLAEDQALLPPLEQQLARSRHNLALLVGKAPADWQAPDFDFADFKPPAEIPVSLPSALARRRPDILAAEADFHADTARIGVAAADLYPDIRLGAAYTQTALTPASLFTYGASGWNVGPSVTLPIFNGGALKARRQAAEAQARVSLARYRQTVLKAFTQVSDVLAALAHDDERLVAVRRAEAAADAGLADTRTALRLGGGAELSVVEAQRRVDRARFNRIDAEGQRLADVIELYAATATDWRDAK
jgi:NodT family efflux transporter outer membrane factor (OMF) lipoprotein